MKFLENLLIGCIGVLIGTIISGAIISLESRQVNPPTDRNKILDFHYVECDKATNIEYLIGKQSLTVRYNTDGTLKQCDEKEQHENK